MSLPWVPRRKTPASARQKIRAIFRAFPAGRPAGLPPPWRGLWRLRHSARTREVRFASRRRSPAGRGFKLILAATSAAVPVEAMKEVPLAGLRIGVPREYFGAGLDPRVSQIIRASLNQFEAAGAILMDISLPHASYALPTYYIVMPAEVSANLA